MIYHRILPVVGCFLFWEVAYGETIRLEIKPGPPNLVTFVSQAPLETIVGKTNSISGWISFNPADLSQPVASDIVVNMATLDTDNKIRNGHMRDNHLHTDRYPTSRFQLKKILVDSGMPLPDGEPMKFSIQGEFTLHGVTRSIQPSVTATWKPTTKTLEVTAQFTVKLSDYQIPRPQFLVMKLDEEQKVTVYFQASGEKGSSGISSTP